MEYFEIFDLPPKLGLDLQSLQQRFHALSRQHHPDYHRNRSAEEQERSLRTTALLNDAYRTLRDPTRRVEYVIESHGIRIDGTNVPQALLAEVFEINEELEELRSAPKSGKRGATLIERLRDYQRIIDAKQERYDAELSAASRRWDELVDSAADIQLRKQHLATLADIVAQSGYLRNLKREIESEVSG